MRHTLRLYPKQAADPDAAVSLRGQYGAESTDTDLFGYPMCLLLLAVLQFPGTAPDNLVKAINHAQGDIGHASRIAPHRRSDHISQQMLNRIL